MEHSLKKQFVVAPALLLAFVCANAADTSPDIREHSIRVGIGLTADHPQGQAVKKFADVVASRSGGKMKVSLFPDGTLGNDLTMIYAVERGMQEMVVPDTATIAGQIPDFGVLNYPFLFNDEDEADQLLDGEFGRKLLAKLPPRGLIGLGFWENGFRQATNSKRPIQKVEDFAGLKIRVMQNPMFIDTFNTLGANAVPMAFTDLFSALETKFVDGQENPVPTIKSSKFDEVQTYLTLSRHTYSVWVPLVSKKFWDGLNPNEQKVLVDSEKEARAFERKTIRAAGRQALDELKKAGMQVNELPPTEVAKLREKTRPVISKYTREFGEATTNEMFTELDKIRAAKDR